MRVEKRFVSLGRGGVRFGSDIVLDHGDGSLVLPFISRANKAETVDGSTPKNRTTLAWRNSSDCREEKRLRRNPGNGSLFKVRNF